MWVYIYKEKTEDFFDEKWIADHIKEVSGLRQERIKKLRCHKDKVRSLLAGRLLLRALSDRGLDPDTLSYDAAPGGKPFLRDDKTNEPIPYTFNLSHSGDYVVCALSKVPVGIDIQEIKKGPQTDRIIRRFFSEREKEELLPLEEEEKSKAFTRIWTLKESFVKTTGEGLRIPLDQIEFTKEDPIRIRREGLLLNDYCAKSLGFDDGYALSVCLEDDSIEIVQA